MTDERAKLLSHLADEATKLAGLAGHLRDDLVNWRDDLADQEVTDFSFAYDALASMATGLSQQLYEGLS